MKPLVAGQAVIEGVMMMSPKHLMIAVRRPNNTISLKKIKHGMDKRKKILKLPLIRGVAQLFSMLVWGTKALTYSANESIGEKEEKLRTHELIITIIVSLLFSILLFVVAPYAITNWFGFIEEQTPVLFNLVDGLVKLAIFIAYIYIISLMEDVRRVFQYHGAEHKVVNCYEADKPLNIKNVKKFTTIHPRCGTSFIIFTLLIGIVVFSFVPIVVSWLVPMESFSFIVQRIILLVARLVFLFPLAAISYEFLRFTASNLENPLVRIIAQPGWWVQRLTTREPTKDQLEVSLKAMIAALKADKMKYRT